MKAKMLLICIMSLIIVGCSDPKIYKLPEKISALAEDAAFKKEVEKLNDDDKKLLSGFIDRAVMAEVSGQAIEKPTTVGGAIRSQQEWLHRQVEESAAKKKQVQDEQSEQDKTVEQMRAVVTPAIRGFKYKKDKQGGHFTVDMSFKNNSQSEVTGIYGELVINDRSDTELKRSTLSIAVRIKPNQEFSQVWSLYYDALNGNDNVLKDVDASTLTFGWIPVTYTFADGKKLTL